jgi:hypothetical protein
MSLCKCKKVSLRIENFNPFKLSSCEVGCRRLDLRSGKERVAVVTKKRSHPVREMFQRHSHSILLLTESSPPVRRNSTGCRYLGFLLAVQTIHGQRVCTATIDFCIQVARSGRICSVTQRCRDQPGMSELSFRFESPRGRLPYLFWPTMHFLEASGR